MIPIGGYFELELTSGGEYHTDALALNSGRNCLEYILLANKYKKLYLPAFSCNVLMEPLHRNGVEYEFYRINEYLLPVIETEIKENEALLIINYFGLLGDGIKEWGHYAKNIIIDNSQAFYSKPLIKASVFYSPRKFFGVPDGGYLKEDLKLDKQFETDHSAERFEHLLTRLEGFPEKGYAKYADNEQAISNQEIKWMSIVTKKILGNIDYKIIADKRKSNYRMLEERLGKINTLKVQIDEKAVPLCYPLLVEKENLRDYLIENKIYVPNYWPDISDRFTKNNIEEKLTSFLLPLPVDQRYSNEHMNFIVNTIMKKIAD